MKRILLLIVMLAVAKPLFAQAETVFKGRPSLRISTNGIEQPALEKLSREKVEQYDCAISKIGDEYYWASRENRPMVRIDAGAYVLFLAREGAGYVRIVKPELKEAAALVDPAAQKYDYVEHLLLHLGSITYYGTRQ